ncbi:hypothetical protein ACER0C_013608 [Sarotherodon galilaeus]
MKPLPAALRPTDRAAAASAAGGGEPRGGLELLEAGSSRARLWEPASPRPADTDHISQQPMTVKYTHLHQVAMKASDPDEYTVRPIPPSQLLNSDRWECPTKVAHLHPAEKGHDTSGWSRPQLLRLRLNTRGSQSSSSSSRSSSAEEPLEQLRDPPPILTQISVGDSGRRWAGGSGTEE